MSVVIIDYGLGNVGSIANMIKRIGGDAIVSSDKAVIEAADKLILPGVGTFDAGMTNLRQRGFEEILHRLVEQRRTLILGICLGMQLMTRSSEEGRCKGFGWFEADTKRFKFDEQQSLRVPHMGWNHILPAKEHPVLQSLDESSRFYFVHSYHVVPDSAADVLCTTDYGYNFISGVQRDNVIGVQFHPEKSHRYGMALMENFLKMDV